MRKQPGLAAALPRWHPPAAARACARRTHSCSVAPRDATKRASSGPPVCVGTERTHDAANTVSCVKYANGASAAAVGAGRPYAPSALSIITAVATLQNAWLLCVVAHARKQASAREKGQRGL
jgi:hypothetical protein